MPYIDKSNVKEIEKYREYMYNSEFCSVKQDITEGNYQDDTQIIYLEKNDIIQASMKVNFKKIDKRHYIAVAFCPMCDMLDRLILKELIEEINKYINSSIYKGKVILLKICFNTNNSEKISQLYQRDGYTITQLNKQNKQNDEVEVFTKNTTVKYTSKVVSNIQNAIKQKYTVHKFDISSPKEEVKKYIGGNDKLIINKYMESISKYVSLDAYYVAVDNNVIGYMIYMYNNGVYEVIIDRGDNISAKALLYDKLINDVEKTSTIIRLTNIYDTEATIKLKKGYQGQTYKTQSMILSVVIKKFNYFVCKLLGGKKWKNMNY